MSRKKREAVASGLSETSQNIESLSEKQSFWQSLGKIERYFAVGIIGLLAAGVFGAVGSNLNLFGGTSSANPTVQNSANPNSATQNSTSSQSINPTNASPPTSATPQLSKEYVYAGSRMLAVEDANANAAPPADLAVWRPSNQTFYVLGGIINGQNFPNIFYQWGLSSDRPAPGDFDGDGITDFSIFRPSNGQWWVMKSSDSTVFAVQFGASCPENSQTPCDITAQADYDGDGKTDAAVFRPTDGTWYILPSSGGSYYGEQFGLATDIPAPADYDGDGKADVGVWRNSNTTFYSRNSNNSALSAVNIGQTSSQPVSGDYDGDGRADYAIRNGANWIIKRSSNGAVDTIAWQDGADKAVQNDYDGDGKVDIATWKTAGGIWKILNSSNGQTRTEYWGIAEDIPVPAYYRR
jgi:FG-GAP-like repeat